MTVWEREKSAWCFDVGLFVFGLYHINPARLDGRQEGEDLGHEWRQLRKPVVKGAQGNDSNVAACKVLLILDALVGGQHHAELGLGDVKQVAVLYPIPSAALS